MTITITSPNTYTRELAVSLTWEDVAEDFEETLQTFRKRVKLPGFRPGKVPLKIVLNHYQPVIEEDFIEKTIQKHYQRALEDKNLIPVNQAKISDLEYRFQERLAFKATFEIEPEIELPHLKKNSLQVQRTHYETDEEDIDRIVEDIRLHNAEIRTVEEAKEGHFLVVDLQKLDSSGVPIIGEKWERRYLKVGEGIGGGDNLEQLLGLKVGDKARIYIAEKENDPPTPFEITVHNIEEQVLPEITPEFIKRVDPQATNEAEWRANLQERLKQQYVSRSQEAFDRQLADAMIALVDPPCPPSMVEAYLDHLVEEIKADQPGQELDDEKVRETYRPAAERNLKWYLIRKAIIKDQGLSVSPEEIQEEIQRLKERSPDQAKEIDRYYRKPSHRSRIEDDLIEQKVLSYLAEFAKVKEVTVATRDLREQSGEKGPDT
jgi:trigger factor